MMKKVGDTFGMAKEAVVGKSAEPEVPAGKTYSEQAVEAKDYVVGKAIEGKDFTVQKATETTNFVGDKAIEGKDFAGVKIGEANQSAQDAGQKLMGMFGGAKKDETK
ncbi:hypothetical protein M5689_014950 [Euphorbia peplus]|nr:hypothetical protein M5689_014950 [Euphorbia peplus]